MMDIKEKLAFGVWRKFDSAGQELDDTAANYVWPQVKGDRGYYTRMADAVFEVIQDDALMRTKQCGAHQVSVDLSILQRAEFELTHSERTGDVDDKIVPELRAIIEDHLAGRTATAPEPAPAAPIGVVDDPDPIIPLIIPPAPISLDWKCSAIGVGIGAVIAAAIIWWVMTMGNG